MTTTNVIRPKNLFRKESAVEQVDVAPILNLLETLFRASAITANTYRLGHIVCAWMQEDKGYETAINRSIAAVTATVLNGDPCTGPVDTDSLQFSVALQQLQAYIGIYNHENRAGLKRAKDRWVHFTQPKLGDSETKQLHQDALVYMEYRPAERQDLEEAATEIIQKRLWIAKFAEIRTTK